MHSQLTFSPKGLTLGGHLLAKRAANGAVVIDGREAQIQALLIAAYGKPVSRKTMDAIKRAGTLLSQVQDGDWDNRTPHRADDVPVLAKAHMMLALTGLGDMEEENLPSLTKTMTSLEKGISASALLKSYLRKDDDDEDDDSDDDDSDDEEEGDGDEDFNAKHPRWPAGSSGGVGGEFAPKDDGSAVSTPNADSGSISTDQTRSAVNYDPNNTAMAETFRQAYNNANNLSYSDGTPAIDPNTGNPYPIPDGMDIAANVKAAEDYDPDATAADKASSMVYWFSQGGPQDYQRPDGYIPALFGDYVGDNRNVTNYNYGAVSAAMGYSLDETLSAAGLYNQIRGNTNQPDMNPTYGIQNKVVNNITQGYQDYIDGKWTTKK